MIFHILEWFKKVYIFMGLLDYNKYLVFCLRRWEEEGLRERRGRRWRPAGGSRGTKAGATTSGRTSASACRGAGSPRIALYSARTI